MEYQLIRSRRKTLSIEITPRGEVIVRAPARMPKRDIQHFLESRQDWIAVHLAKISQQPAVIPMTSEEHQSLIQAAKNLIPAKVAFYAQKAKVTYGRISIRSQHTRWGSCSASGNLSFNCLLLLTPPAVQDYVIIHELCHRKEMNHSPRFWSAVEAHCPDYKTHKAWLKEHGPALMARLPQK